MIAKFGDLLLGWLAGKALDRAMAVVPSSATESLPLSTPPRVPARSRRPTRPGRVAPAATSTSVPASTTPEWPQVTPTGLPPFPGPGWVPDNPPPSAVVSRAVALLPALWRSGEGTFRVEKTAGRWIAYQARQMGAKRGVVAFREASPSAASAAATPTTTLPTMTVRASAPPPSSAVALPTLRRGSRGNDVVILQQRLGIQADGIFGADTEKAVMAYQRSHGLKVDGIVGRDTWGSLMGGTRAA